MIFKDLVAMRDLGTPVDLVLLKNEMIRLGHFGQVGGIEYERNCRLTREVESLQVVGWRPDLVKAIASSRLRFYNAIMFCQL